jgi:hypothetical protein
MYWRPPDPDRDPLWYRHELRAIGFHQGAVWEFDRVCVALAPGPPGRRFLRAYRCQACGGALVLLHTPFPGPADAPPDLREAQFLWDHRHADEGEEA